MNQTKFRNLCLAMAMCVGSPLWAAIIGTPAQPRIGVAVHPSKPQAVLAIQAGQKFYIVGKSNDGKWLQITIPRGSGKFASGWVQRASVKVLGKTAANAPQANVALAPAIPTPPPSVPASPFPNSGFSAVPTSPTTSTPNVNGSNSRPATTLSSPSSSSSNSFLADKLFLGADLGYHLLNQKVVSTPATAGAAADSFEYKIAGAGVFAYADYDGYEMMNGQLVLGSLLGFGYTMYSAKTNLLNTNSPPVQFASLTSKSTSTEFDLKLKARYKFSASKSAMSAGLALGYHLFNFKGDDVATNTDAAGTPVATDGVNDDLGMYVSFKSSAVLFGLNFSAPFGKITGILGTDVLLLPSYSESPGSGTLSGVSMKAGTGFIPYLGATYELSPHHNIDLMYKLRYQTVQYSGTGYRLLTTLTDAKGTSTLHQLSVGYKYVF